jgi:flagellar hook protein FlgE
VTANFTKTGANGWSYQLTIPGADLTSGTAGTPSEIGTGTLTFDSNGRLTAPAAGAPVSVTVTGIRNGAADLAMSWDLFRADGASRLTQFAEASATSANSQNGIAAAQVSRITLATDGQVIASFSDGSNKIVGQLALAAISNPDSLVSVGGNDFEVGANTNAPVIGLAGTGGRGGVEAGALESSTVDVAREFTNLIVYQRGYQANSKVITTLDEMAQETIGIKR